jgi:hypothetical protein
MREQEQNRVLRDAARLFPEGCLCEDCRLCAYCCFILSLLGEPPGAKLELGGILDKIQFNIPAGWLAQIYELKRVFRLCI